MSQATIRTFTAALLDSQLDTGEEARLSWEPVRRTALALLTRDYDSIAAPLRQNDDEAAQALIELAERLDDYLELRDYETDLLKAARARIWLVLGQEADRLDADEIEREAQQ